MALVNFSATDIGNRRQLFIDEKFIAAKQGVELVVHPPVDCGPVVQEDRPCEKDGIYGYVCVLENPLGDGVHRMNYYTAQKPAVMKVVLPPALTRPPLSN